MTTTTYFEYRTKKVPVAQFQTLAQAEKWLDEKMTRAPAYARSLILFKVTTETREETVR